MKIITSKVSWYFYGLFSFTSITVCLLVSVFSSRAFGIARGYLTNDSGLQVGMAAALSTEGAEGYLVERASQQNQSRAIGVVTTVDEALITAASANAKIYIETEGEVEAYVSDIGGIVKRGDLLVLSPLKGILMKADDTSPAIFAVSNSDFIVDSSQQYRFPDGNVKEARISKLIVNLNRKATGNSNQISDSSLRKIGKAIVGKDVGEIRVVIALIIFFVVLITEGGTLYGVISSAIKALGRNPLAGKVIRRELIRIVFIALLVFIIGLISIYGILWI